MCEQEQFSELAPPVAIHDEPWSPTTRMQLVTAARSLCEEGPHTGALICLRWEATVVDAEKRLAALARALADLIEEAQWLDLTLEADRTDGQWPVNKRIVRAQAALGAYRAAEYPERD